MKRFVRFVRHYRMFSFATLAAVAALGLDIASYDTAAHWVLSVGMVCALLPLLWGMVQDIRHGTYGVDILAATAIIVAIVMQEYWAGMVIVLMLTGGESLEDYAEHRAKRELDTLLQSTPQKARILRGRTEVEVRASDVQIGDKISVRPGEVVPVDAVILEGTSSFDDSSITGESMPEAKQPGDTIVSGSINIDGAIIARTLHAAADSQYQQIVRLVRSAAKSQAPFVRLADRYAIPFTIISFGIAGAAWALSGEAIRFLQVLVVATPCPLILAAPIAIISGMSRATRHGIIIKNGSALERLAAAKTFAFDKTGTLTQGKLAVDQLTAYNGFAEDDVLRLTAAIEQHSNHVLAQAIMAKSRAAGHKPAKARHVRELAGSGLEATVDGKHILIGRLSMLKQYEVELPAQFDPKRVQATAAFVAIDRKLAGVITFKDELRTETKSTLQKLRALGVRDILMVTGDNKAVAAAVAKRAGITNVHAEALPGDKIRAIEHLQHRPVAFVGDGVNDAPVLTASDVGIALGAKGTTIASESADVVIMLDDLERVATGQAIAKRTFHIAKQSILIGIGLSIILMLVFATGRFKPIYGAAIQELVDVIVIFNALRAHGRLPRLRVKKT